MRRAGYQRPISTRAIPATPSDSTPNAVAFVDSPLVDELLATREAIIKICPPESDDHDERHRALEIAIYQRIESRLLGRVRDLLVRAFDGVVILEGECATYYTKQLAQHAAMGILEDEQLENEIVVRVQ